MTVQVAKKKRQETEIYTRVVGYYRPVAQFNVGKKSEYKDRKEFRQFEACNDTPVRA